MFRRKVKTEFSKCVASKTIYIENKAFIPIQCIDLKVIDINLAGFGTIESQGIIMVDDSDVKLFSEDENIDLESLINDIPELEETVHKLGGRL